MFSARQLIQSSIRRESQYRSLPCHLKRFNTHTNPVLVGENAVASTDAKGFDKRERGEESRFAREKEMAELKHLRDELARQKAKIEELEKSVKSGKK